MKPTVIRVTTTPEHMARAMHVFMSVIFTTRPFTQSGIEILDSHEEMFVSDGMPEELADRILKKLNDRFDQEMIADTTEAIAEQYSSF